MQKPQIYLLTWKRRAFVLLTSECPYFLLYSWPPPLISIFFPEIFINSIHCTMHTLVNASNNIPHSDLLYLEAFSKNTNPNSNVLRVQLFAFIYLHSNTITFHITFLFLLLVFSIYSFSLKIGININKNIIITLMKP